MADYGMKEPIDDGDEVAFERLNYDVEECMGFVERYYHRMSEEQREIYLHVTQAVLSGRQVLGLIDGPAGTGKTLLLQLITAFLRAQRKIVHCMAPTAIAALNHENGNVTLLLIISLLFY